MKLTAAIAEFPGSCRLPRLNDSTEIRWKNDPDIVNFQCEGSEEVQIADFDLKVDAD